MKKFILIVTVLSTLTLSAQKKNYTLEECVRMALEKNINIKQTELDIDNARNDQWVAKQAFLPNLNVQSQHIWNNGLSQNITNGLIENLTTQFSSLGASAGVTLFNGRQNFNQLYRANLNVLARQYQLDDIKDNTSLFVANAYLQIMFNRELEQVQRYQLELTKAEYERTQNLIQAGVLTGSDLYDIEANVAEREQALIQAENAYRLARISLAQLLLITDYENFDIAEEDFAIPFSEILNETPKSIFNKALSFRNDIKLGETNIEIAKKDIDLAKGNLLPSLNAFYSYNTRISYSDRSISSGVLEDFPIGVVRSSGGVVVTQVPQREVVGPLPFGDQFTQNDGHSFGLSLNIPVFNGSNARSAIKRSQINLERVQNQLEQTKLTLESNINQAYNDASGAFKVYEATQKTLLAREEAYKVAQNRYSAGVMNSFDFIIAQQRYQIAASDIVRAKFDYIFKLKVLEFYFGLTLNAK